MIKCGVDIVRVDRLKNVSPDVRKRFINRVFTENEQAQLRDNDENLLAVIAVKEAVSKALGTGIGKVSWRHIEVIHLPTGEPTVNLHDYAATVAKEKGLDEWSVSISHDGGFAVAMVVATGKG